MWEIWMFSLQSGLELMTTRMIDEVLTNWNAESAFHFCAGKPEKTEAFGNEIPGTGLTFVRRGNRSVWN